MPRGAGSARPDRRPAGPRRAAPLLRLARHDSPSTSADRFARLLAPAAWGDLPAPVRRRFGQHLGPTANALYAGGVASTRQTRARRVCGQLARLYARPGRPPQVIHSTKSFDGPTGLEECVGAGVGMRLTLGVEKCALVFCSAGFFLRLGSRSFALLAWLTPGIVEVRRREERSGRFRFTLTITHPWFGIVIEQVAFFSDPSVRAPRVSERAARRT